MTRFLPLLIATSLLACDDEGIEETEDTTAETEETEEVVEDERILDEGEYIADPADASDGCDGIFQGGSLLPANLVWTDDVTFELRYLEEGYDVSDIVCDASDAANIACSGFVQYADSGKAVLTLDATTNAFTVLSTESYEIDWTWDLTCEGSDEDCAAFGVTLPCSAEVLGTFSL